MSRFFLPATGLLTALLWGCGGAGQETGLDTPELLVPGTLLVGAAEDYLSLPVGTPMGGYTSRLQLWGYDSNVDDRDSAYAVQFAPSVGIQTRIPVKAFWFDNGQQDLVLLQVDVIYAYDGLLSELEDRLQGATGLDLHGRVVIATTHSHNSYGNYCAQPMFFLGGDIYNHENFTRMAESLEAVGLAAWDSRQEAAIGVGHALDWDPTDLVYHDRRSENDDLQIFDDLPAGPYKDPNLWMIRVDTLGGEPLAVLYGFGMHGTSLGADNPMISVDAPGHTVLAFQERFQQPVVVGFFQGSGGDASPGGGDDWFARLESVGDRAAGPLAQLWESIPTSPVTVGLETRTTALHQDHDNMRVDRNGQVDWSYAPYDESADPDEIIYDEDGQVASPIDEFNAQYGAVFCGEDEPYLSTMDLDVDIYPYTSCTRVDLLMTTLQSYLQLDDDAVAMPLEETTATLLTASRMGPLPTLLDDGQQRDQDLLMAFFPGETLSLYNEMARRRIQDELGIADPIAVGYAQDHEGYLLLAEDWLEGGYEPQIAVWGPLQGDHMMDAALLLAGDLLTEQLEPNDSTYTEWGPWDLPQHQPDTTPDAGTLLSQPPAYLYSPLLSQEELDEGQQPDLDWPDQVPRVQGILQVCWKGGDPAVDLPRVVLERLDAGTWTEVLSHSGRPITSAFPDILLAHTPDPLSPAEADQVHYWWAAWQAMGHVVDRTGLPLGEYRLHITGQRATGGSSWPFTTEPYELTTESTTIVAGEIRVETSGDDLLLSLPGPERGFRHIAEDGSYRGDNPLSGGTAHVTWTMDDSTTLYEKLTGGTQDGHTLLQGVVPEEAVAVEVSDIFGNQGNATVP